MGIHRLPPLVVWAWPLDGVVASDDDVLASLENLKGSVRPHQGSGLRTDSGHYRAASGSSGIPGSRSARSAANSPLVFRIVASAPRSKSKRTTGESAPCSTAR